jgi:predicted esterase
MTMTSSHGMNTTCVLLLCIATVAETMTNAPPPTMKRILCLHGKSQSGAVLSNKIAGARRKLARVYELHFLDAPIEEDKDGLQLAWWVRDDKGNEILVENAFDYVLKQTEGKHYDALLGFSQGGLLATALAVSGKLPGIQAVLTAGSPYRKAPFDVASALADQTETDKGKAIPKLHFAGETDAMIPVESVNQLCEVGGNGEVVVHEKGHLFPTKAVHVNYMLEFLEKSLSKSYPVEQ